MMNMAKKRLRSRNKKGQFAKGVSILITKELKAAADACDIRVKAVVKDALEQKYKDNVLASYAPTSDKGKEIAEYNKTHKKRQLAAHYHHTGTFLRSIYAAIDGNTVVIKQRPLKYDDGTPVETVREWLTKGTTKTPKHDQYYFKKDGETILADYHPTPIHPFELNTLIDMTGFMDSLAANIKQNGNKYYKRYLKKNARKR